MLRFFSSNYSELKAEEVKAGVVVEAEDGVKEEEAGTPEAEEVTGTAEEEIGTAEDGRVLTWVGRLL